MPSFPTPATPVSDGAVSLRLAAERDIPEVLIAYQDDAELHRRLGEPRPPSGAELGRRAERAEAERVAGSALTLTITLAGEDTCRGQIQVDRVDWDNLRANLRVWVAPRSRGRGLGRAALALAARWLLLESGLERVQVLAAPDDEPMLRAAQAAGFSREGVLRGHERGVDRRLDAVSLSLIRRDLRT